MVLLRCRFEWLSKTKTFQGPTCSCSVSMAAAPDVARGCRPWAARRAGGGCGSREYPFRHGERPCSGGVPGGGSIDQAGLTSRDSRRIVACLGLAGASEPSCRAAAQLHRHPYRDVIVTTDAHVACAERMRVGMAASSWSEPAASAGPSSTDGSSGSADGDWRFPTRAAEPGSDVRRCAGCKGPDGRIPWTGLLTALFERFPFGSARGRSMAANAAPRDLGRWRPRSWITWR